MSQVPSATSVAVFGVFVGTSPSGEGIRQLLQIPSDSNPDLIQWELTLHQDQRTLAPTRYELRCKYGFTTPDRARLAREIKTVERQGSWTKTKGTKDNPGASVFELQGALSLLQVSDTVLHVLNADRSLMIGNSDWSYSLSRADRAEKPVQTGVVVGNKPDLSSPNLPLATGPNVFAVFEGRSPCLGIARHLGIQVPAGCLNAKWRVTLYQDPITLGPTTFQMEGTLFRGSPVVGSWVSFRGHENNSTATVFRLEPSSKGPALYLAGDENVLFFLNQNLQPFVGNVHFSYTLNRRSK